VEKCVTAISRAALRTTRAAAGGLGIGIGDAAPGVSTVSSYVGAGVGGVRRRGTTGRAIPRLMVAGNPGDGLGP
jgi:hypothetical protein